jgi:large subunit ribosomal protein L15
VLNVAVLEEAFGAGDEVTPESVRKAGLIGNVKDGIKVLGHGELKKKLKVTAHAFSKSAEEKITKAGGEVIRL